MRGLVGDPSPTMRRIYASALRDAGCDQIVSVSDGKEALAQASPDTALVIADLDLPAINGIELTRRLRANAETASVPVLIVTGRDDEEDVRAARDAAASGYLLRPFALEELRLRIEALLPREASSGESRPVES